MRPFVKILFYVTTCIPVQIYKENPRNTHKSLSAVDTLQLRLLNLHFLCRFFGKKSDQTKPDPCID